jgi:hypothetical protein
MNTGDAVRAGWPAYDGLRVFDKNNGWDFSKGNVDNQK